ncbi:MAG: hypothetical protein Q8M29_04680 [Bacteroidota bacterium]|nr:hypothetical protein [Bacteroidota bacterium]
MKSKIECVECKIKYEPSRSDQKYCSDTCRWNAWREREEIKKAAKKDQSLAGADVPKNIKEPEKKDLFASLRSVPENKATETKAGKTETAVQPKVEQEKVIVAKEIPQTGPLETKEYKEAIAEKQRVDTLGKRVIADLQTCDSEINSINSDIDRFAKTPNTKQKMRFRNWNIDAEDLFGAEVLDKEIDHTFKSQELQQRLKSFLNRKSELHKELDQANRDMNIVMSKLKNIDQYEKPKPQEKKLDLANILKSIQSKKVAEQKQEIKMVEKVVPEEIETNINEAVETNVLEEENAFEDEENTNNGKLVSSRDLRKRKYNCFPFTGKWKDFFGLPSYAFHLAVHGKPGEGKSTFCVQFADYLAKNFGKVVYVSGEEGLSKTVQDKVINNGIDNPYLIFADIKSYDEIKTEIPNEFHFIFIDSLDTLRIDAAKLKALKEHYPQSAFITISQSTKDGKMRGSLEITHDTDIAAKVENGVAITTKNRFQARGTEFQVFGKFDSGKHKLDEPKKLM